jgi:RNA polymerase sigma-70 factor, ECF subfamily
MASAQSLTFYEFDSDYLHGLNTRDPDIEDHFVGYFSSLLHGKIRRRSSSLEQMNDIRQETFVRVLTAIRTHGRIRQPERLGAFVSTVCDNILYESFRSEKHYQPIADLPAEPLDPGRSPEAILAGTEATTELRLAMSRMPHREKTVLTAVFLEQKDKDEVCRQLGISRSNLRVLLHRAKKKLRQLYRNMHKVGSVDRTRILTRPAGSST